MSAPAIRITAMGSRGLLLDSGLTVFDVALQHRVQAVAAALQGAAGITEIVPGMNNLMIEVDPAVLPMADAAARLRTCWAAADAAPAPGKAVEIPVVYGGAEAEDFGDWVAATGLSAEDAVARHAAGAYEVAAIGAMPGFGYLSGLDPALARPRRKVPRGRVPKGAVIVGGAQAAVMPIAAPSGWHIIGMTGVVLFDASADPPCLLAPGDRVRFVAVDAPR